MMEVDPYSTACVEVKPKLRVFKSQECAKKLEFFSQAGKSRLLRICDENHLDDEVIFTGCWVGPSDSFVRDQVSDYVQHYLFKRARRLSIERQILQIKLGAQTQQGDSQRKLFQNFENYVRKMNEETDKSRATEEVLRIRDLLIAGEISTFPVGFEDIANDPIFKVNRVLDKVKCLEKSKLNTNDNPFSIQTNSILDMDSEQVEEYQKVLPDLFNSKKSVLQNMDDKPLELSNKSKPNVSEADCQSLSSGFEEITSSQTGEGNEYQVLPQSALSNAGYIIDDLPSERARSASSFSDIDDQELSDCAEEYFANEHISGDLEIHLDFSWESKPVTLVKQQSSCIPMYEVASKVVEIYEKQKVAGQEFMEEFTSRYFGK